MSKEKEYEVEFKSTTYRSYFVTASNKKEAQRVALADLDNDWEVDSSWSQGAEVHEIYKQGNKDE